MYFEQHPHNYQEAINRSIINWIPAEEVGMISAYREAEAEGLLGCEIFDCVTLATDEFDDKVVNFRAGWEARQQALDVTILSISREAVNGNKNGT